MRSNLLQSTALTLALFAGVSLANAQSPQSIPKEPQNSAGHEAQRTVPGQNGKEEPSSHSTADSVADPDAVFVNGTLNVPGVPQNTDTVPAKFSENNAADDKLITVAYTFKVLPDDQRAAILRALKDEQPVLAFRADVGTELPTSVELRAIPSELAKRVPMTEGYQYAVSDRHVMVVSPATRIVVAVYSEDQTTTIGAGRRAR